MDVPPVDAQSRLICGLVFLKLPSKPGTASLCGAAACGMRRYVSLCRISYASGGRNAMSESGLGRSLSRATWSYYFCLYVII